MPVKKKPKTNMTQVIASLPRGRPVVAEAGVLHAPTAAIFERFDWTCNTWAAVAVVTNACPSSSWVHDMKVGLKFGHLCMLNEATDYTGLAIAKLSWSIGTFSYDTLGKPIGYPRKYEEKIIKPTPSNTFTIKPGKWADDNGISQTMAVEKGEPLGDVLQMMLKDLRYATVGCNFRLCMHSLEHEARVIQQGMLHAGIEASFWVQVATNGLCIMDPYLTQWIFNTAGDPLESKIKSLRAMAEQFLCPDKLRKQPAIQRWLVVQKLHQQARKFEQPQASRSR